jgi:hypothetical protein
MPVMGVHFGPACGGGQCLQAYRSRGSAIGPLWSFVRRHPSVPLPTSRSAWTVCAAKGCADGPRRLAEAACALARRLPCGARARGPAQNSLRDLRSLRSNNCAESDHEARIRARPQALRSSAPHMRAATRPHTPLWERCRHLWRRERTRLPERRAVPGGGDLCGGEKRRPGVGARSALRKLTRGSCPSAATEGRVASSAARPRAEHRSAVGAARRPPQHEPLPGTARRDAPTEASRTSKTSAADSGERHFTRDKKTATEPDRTPCP